MAEFIPYGRQVIDEADLAAVNEVLRGDWLTQGPAVERFELALADKVGAGHAVAVSSGTAALHLIYLALGIGPGDAVIVPAITFAATANAVLYTGATPVFADVETGSYGLDPASAVEAIGRALQAGLRPKALAAVHYAGRPADLTALAELALQHGLALVEDACHALGAEYRLSEADGFVPVGSGGRLAAWSFHPVKHIATGEGGAVTTDDASLAERIRRLRTHGITKEPAAFVRPDWAYDPSSGELNPWYHEMQDLGFNYRLPDVSAALGASQLAKLNRFVSRRREIARRYDEALAALPHLILPPGDGPLAKHSYHLYPLWIDFAALGLPRAALMRRLHALGIGTQVHYLPVFEHPYYHRNPGRWLAVPCPQAARLYAGELSIPMFPSLTDLNQERVIAGLRQMIAR